MNTSKIKSDGFSKSVEQLSGLLENRLYQPGQKGYDELRTPWLRVVDQYPALIVEAASVGDIIAAVRFAREQSLPLGVMSTGHGISAACDDGLLLRLTKMKRIEINAETGIARIEPGVTSGELLAAAEKRDLVFAGGQVSNVGVFGYALGGGIGWLVRKFGAACAAVRRAEMILADGSFVTADDAENSDLFWAIRGGGGNFGIVASLEVQLEPLENIVGGEVWYPLTAARDVMKFYREWTFGLSEDTSAVLRLEAVAPDAKFPVELRGKTGCMICLCHANPATADDVLKPLLAASPPVANNIKVRRLSEMAQLNPASGTSGARSYEQAEYLKTLSDEVIDGLLTFAEKSILPAMQIEVQQLGGALSPSDASAYAFTPSAAPFLLHWETTETPTTTLAKIAEATQKAVGDLGDVYTGEAYYNYLRGDEQSRIADAFGGGKYERLREIKRKFDPENLFHLNLNIAPAQQ